MTHVGCPHVGCLLSFAFQKTDTNQESLEAALYGFGEEIESNALEAHISRLRSKLGKDLIITHRGLGYGIAG